MTRLLWLWPLTVIAVSSDDEPVTCLTADPTDPTTIGLCSAALQEGGGPSISLLVKRALAYEADSKYAQALADFQHASELEKEKADDKVSEKAADKDDDKDNDKDEEMIKLGLGRVLLAMGQFEQAKSASNEKAKEAWEKSQKAVKLIEQSKWQEADRLLAELLLLAPAWIQGHSMRVKALMAMEKWQDAQRALQQRAQWEVDANDTAFQVAKLQLAQGHLERGRKLVDDCARDDPDHKACHRLRKKLKEIPERMEQAKKMLLHPSIEALEALLTECKGESGKDEPYWDDALPRLLVGYEGPLSVALCNRLVRVKQGEKAIPHCKRSLQLALTDADRLQATIELAQAHRWAEEWEEATALLNDARNKWPRSADLSRAAKEINEARKKANRRDYYAILGVPKDANDDLIQRAYNKAARKWHPDKQRTEEDKQKAMKRMQEINAAYAILKDPTKRQQVDAGLDPENPEDQAAARNPFYGSHGGGINIEDLFRAAASQGGGRRSSYSYGGSYGGSSYGGGNRRKRQHQQHQDFYDFFKDDL